MEYTEEDLARAKELFVERLVETSAVPGMGLMAQGFADLFVNTLREVGARREEA